MVRMLRPATSLERVTQARTGRPSTWTVQAPRSAIPQPSFVPVSPRRSRITHSNGVSGAASTVRDSSLTCRTITL
jgi:hypothetical protein